MKTDLPMATGKAAAPMTVESTAGKSNAPPDREVTIRDLQRLIREMYHEKDVARGIAGTFMWLMEEIGELSSALRDYDGGNKNQEQLSAEFADVIAWLVTIANVAEIDLTQALLEKYGAGCPGCGELVCQCPDEEKP